jgi:hypothetical protein
VYATSAGSIAQDGVGRNGLFTSSLLNNIKTPGLEVTEIFRCTGQDVVIASDSKQIPAVYSQFFGSAYFSRPVVAQTPSPQPSPPPVVAQPVTPASPQPETPQNETTQVAQNVEIPQIVITPSQPSPAPLPAKTKSASVTPPIAYSFMNLAFGLGSYLQGDYAGGAVVTSGYAAAIGFLAWELSMSISDTGAGIPGNIGIVAGIGTLAFGFIKPFLFNNNRRLASAIDNFDVALVSSEQSKSDLMLRYTHSF